LPVILYHSGLDTFSGGFVGVDIFFVISGYLITNSIMDRNDAGTFLLSRFYERRARRILPALFFVVFCCVPFAFLWMPPQQLNEFAKSVVAICLFSSNIQFWSEAGYFAPAVDAKPLLHTWSLAVEEQFYLLFPLFIMVASRYGWRSIATLIVIATLISLALAEFSSHYHPASNFYFLPTRAWELLIGATTAMILLKRSVPNPAINNVLSGLGLAAIVFSIFAFSKTTPFPGLYALAPTLGTALIIARATPGTYVHSLLSLRPLVGLGLISYSTYLWHQPLLAFARLRSLVAVPGPLLVSLALLSIPLGWLTWRMIETPARDSSRFPTCAFVTLMPAAGAILGALGCVLYFHIGFSVRYAFASTIEARMSINYGLSEDCQFDSVFEVKTVCQTGAHPTIAVWGDSFAMHIVDGIVAANPTRSVIQATRSGCGPFLSVDPIDAGNQFNWAESCRSFNRSVLAYLIGRPEISDVVLSSELDRYVGEGRASETALTSQKKNSDLAKQDLLQTIRSLEALGKRVTIVSPPARDGSNVGQCLLKATIVGENLGGCDFPIGEYLAFAGPTTDFLSSMEEDGEARIVWLPKYSCTLSRCRASMNGAFLYRDNGHLSHEGSRWFGTNTPALRFAP
jgi:peptidoglycan/LPS O-acetylase OafA/YrhL